MLVTEARARIERAKKKEYVGYYVGQIVGDMKQEKSTDRSCTTCCWNLLKQGSGWQRRFASSELALDVRPITGPSPGSTAHAHRRRHCSFRIRRRPADAPSAFQLPRTGQKSLTIIFGHL
jgi:hypothetical protein